MKKRLLFLTGSPGAGKTSVLLKILDVLKAERYKVGGMISREVRTHGKRLGFEILDINQNRKGWLAHINHKEGVKYGKYYVNLESLENIGVSAIAKAVKTCDVIVIDEVGPMELVSQKFRTSVMQSVKSEKMVIGTIHRKVKDRLIDAIKTREDTEIFLVTGENRENLYQNVLLKIKEFFS